MLDAISQISVWFEKLFPIVIFLRLVWGNINGLGVEILKKCTVVKKQKDKSSEQN